jgi:hypothetical protein
MVPMIDNPHPDVVNVKVGFIPLLMGTFKYLPRSGDVKFISATPDHKRAEILQVSLF